jgi:hypothetical protein
MGYFVPDNTRMIHLEFCSSERETTVTTLKIPLHVRLLDVSDNTLENLGYNLRRISLEEPIPFLKILPIGSIHVDERDPRSHLSGLHRKACCRENLGAGPDHETEINFLGAFPLLSGAIKVSINV